MQWSTTPYDFVSKIIVNPATGSVFIASHGFGILKSADGGNSFNLALGGTNQHIYSDIDIANPMGLLSPFCLLLFKELQPLILLVFINQLDDGSKTGASITPNSFPTSQHSRSVVTIAPSNTSTCFAI
ncbi:MAG: hypothetical protein H6609_20265 [Ignavibacteriales bacterium]|nr:hypothetical protein [Ignavibacteriales bacterium]